MTQPSKPSAALSAALGGQWADTYRLLEQQLAQLTSELERVRDERERQAQRLSGVLDALPAAVVVIDGSGRVGEHNHAATELFGEALQGALWREVIARSFVPQVDAHDLLMTNGRIVSLSIAPLGSEPGQILLFNDITETRRLQEHLHRQQRLLDMGQMAANLAHQIRTPLASALLYASQLCRPALTPDKRQRFADNTVNSLKRLERLINNMLLFTRGGVGGEEVLDPAELLQELLVALRPQFSISGVELSLQLETGGERVRANRSVLLSALENLATNAMQALVNRGEVVLFCRPAAAGSVDLGVHDDGPGVAPEMQATLFEPFSTDRARGTGLGLSIVRLVAQAHHGEAWFESQPGDTTFAIRLQAAAVEAGDQSTHTEVA